MLHRCVPNTTHLMCLDSDRLLESLARTQVDHTVGVAHRKRLVLVVPRQLGHRHWREEQKRTINYLNR